jgi:cyclopropane-fatty-acyl-phospholipid synthase
MMPSDSLFTHYNRDLQIACQWRWNGEHYAKTCNAWLERMDSQIDVIRPILEECYGKADAKKWIQRWRLFFMACAELFAFNGGEEWYVSHYLFEPQSSRMEADAATSGDQQGVSVVHESCLEPLQS